MRPFLPLALLSSMLHFLCISTHFQSVLRVPYPLGTPPLSRLLCILAYRGCLRVLLCNALPNVSLLGYLPLLCPTTAMRTVGGPRGGANGSCLLYRVLAGRFFALVDFF